MQKIFGILAHGHAPAMGSQLWFGGIIELVAGAQIAIGFYARYAAFVASGIRAMEVAPRDQPRRARRHLLLLFLFIAAHGAGIAAIDRARPRR